MHVVKKTTTAIPRPRHYLSQSKPKDKVPQILATSEPMKAETPSVDQAKPKWYQITSLPPTIEKPMMKWYQFTSLTQPPSPYLQSVLSAYKPRPKPARQMTRQFTNQLPDPDNPNQGPVEASLSKSMVVKK